MDHGNITSIFSEFFCYTFVNDTFVRDILTFLTLAAVNETKRFIVSARINHRKIKVNCIIFWRSFYFYVVNAEGRHARINMLLTSIGKAVFCQKPSRRRTPRGQSGLNSLPEHPTASFRRWIINFLRSAFSKLKKHVSRRSSSISSVVCPRGGRNQTINRAAHGLPFFIEEPDRRGRESSTSIDVSRLHEFCTKLPRTPFIHIHFLSFFHTRDAVTLR